MAFWFNKKDEQQKADSSQVQQAPVVPQPAPAATSPGPLLKPLTKPGAVPILKVVPSSTPAPAPAPVPAPEPAGLKVRPKVDQRA